MHFAEIEKTQYTIQIHTKLNEFDQNWSIRSHWREEIWWKQQRTLHIILPWCAEPNPIQHTYWCKVRVALSMATIVFFWFRLWLCVSQLYDSIWLQAIRLILNDYIWLAAYIDWEHIRVRTAWISIWNDYFTYMIVIAYNFFASYYLFWVSEWSTKERRKKKQEADCEIGKILGILLAIITVDFNVLWAILLLVLSEPQW